MFINILKHFVNLLHILIALVPIFLYFVPYRLTQSFIHWLLLFMIMVPLHWPFFDNKCLLTIVSQSLGDYKDNDSESAFTEVNCRWLYEPIMKIIGWEWNSKNVGKMVTLHWIINILLVWIYTFYMK